MAELQHYVQRETDALVLAEDVAKQLEGISSLDHMAAAEVEPVPAQGIILASFTRPCVKAT